MYLDAIVRDYQLVILPENKKLHEELEATPLEVLAARLMELQPDLHTKNDLLEKDRVIKALEIIEAKKQGLTVRTYFYSMLDDLYKMDGF